MSNLWEGKKVRLRAVEPSDADTIFEWDLDTDIARLQTQINVPRSVEEAKRWVGELSLRRSDDDSCFLAIENKERQMVGAILSHSVNRRHGNFKYGIGILPKYHRQGYAAEALRLLVRYYFTELRYVKVIGEVYAFNEPSIRFHQSFGFTLEGRLRKMIYTDGQYHDVLVFGMLAEEFTYPEE